MASNSVTGDTASSLVVGTLQGHELEMCTELADFAELHDLILQGKSVSIRPFIMVGIGTEIAQLGFAIFNCLGS